MRMRAHAPVEAARTADENAVLFVELLNSNGSYHHISCIKR